MRHVLPWRNFWLGVVVVVLWRRVVRLLRGVKNVVGMRIIMLQLLSNRTIMEVKHHHPKRLVEEIPSLTRT